MTYNEIKEAIKTAPLTYLPGLLCTMAKTCMARKVFKPGGMARIVQTVEDEANGVPEASKPNDGKVVGSKEVLGTWWNSMPDWAKKSYQNNPHFNAAIQEAACQGKSKDEMMWMLAKVMTERGDDLLQKLIRLEQERPLQIIVPNAGTHAQRKENQ